MTPSLLTLSFVVALATCGLAAIMFFLARRHDEVVASAAPFASIEHLNQQIEDRRDTLASIDAVIEARRTAMEQIADREAELNAIVSQQAELTSELNRLEDRRDEIREMDRETEEAVIRFGAAKRDLEEAEEALTIVQARLDRAESLAGQIADLEEQERRLSREVEKLRDEMTDLRQLKQDEATLRDRLEDLRREEVRLQGNEAAAEDRMQRIAAGLLAAEGNRAEAENRVTEAQAQAVVSEEKRDALAQEIPALEARVALLRTQKGEMDGSGPAESDPLKDLRAMPAVLENLRNLDVMTFGSGGRGAEQDALHLVQKTLEGHGLDYPQRTVHAFHTAMKVNDTTQMAVLAGISGTGKSQLPRRYAEGMGIGFLQVPVQPRWDSPQDLMGFYNYIENRYKPTEMARALYHLDEFSGDALDADLQDRMMMILLDEMNLARVEYYFSDFLSRLESRPPFGADISAAAKRKDASIELELRMPEGQTAPVIYPGYNLLFAGTMNEDESTQALSDKVVDRANVLRFAAPQTLKTGRKTGDLPKPVALSRQQWDNWRRAKLPQDIAPQVSAEVEALAGIMRSLNRPIGHRMGVAIGAYVANYPELEGRASHQLALADQIEMRLLPKLRGVEVDAAETALGKLAEKAKSYGDDALDNAIRDSLDQSRDLGQFNWRGVTR